MGNRATQAFNDARTCILKLQSPDGPNELWVKILQQCFDAGVSPESVGTTPEEIEGIRVDICRRHARQWLTLIRAERSHRRNVDDMVVHMKKWLAEGKLRYEEIEATPEEINCFGEIPLGKQLS